MKNLYLFTIFESDGGRPRCTGVLAGDQVQVFDIYRPGSRTLMKVVNDNKAAVVKLLDMAWRKGANIVTSDFKGHLKAYGLPLDTRTYNVYDLALPDVKPTESLASDTELLERILTKMAKQKIKDWHKVFANAAVVYQDLENRGVWNNYVLEHPIWSQKVKTGRSKTLGFNIQGYTEPHYVIQPGASDKEVLIHFDWISADIRAAALLSGDERLETAFLESDPYTFMMEELNANSVQQLSRDECKLLLLQSINSMDFESVALKDIYPQLGKWIGKCRIIINKENGYLETILGRRFRLAHSKNALAVLNGVQQGSVAHAMQCVIKKVWDRFGHRLIMEGHDSLVVSSPEDPAEAMATIQAIGKLMLYPFEGLSSSPAFPLKVSIGKKWRKWKLRAIFRPNGIEYVKPKAAYQAEEGREEEAAESVEIGPAKGP